MDKKEIAQEKMNQRKNLSKEEKKLMDQAIHKQVLKEVENFKSIALFFSFGHEIETHSLIDILLKRGYKVHLPRVQEKVMEFYQITSREDLVKSSFGILEPKPGQAVSKDAIDVILVPLLAFDKNKFRVGYGGGYYDGYLNDYSGIKIGVAYSFQFTEENFVEAHDIACDYIVSERGVQ